jgi:hypothetical protein
VREGEGRVYREEKLPRERNEENGKDTVSIYGSLLDGSDELTA